VNLYGFADMYKMEKAGDMGGALKLEFSWAIPRWAFPAGERRDIIRWEATISPPGPGLGSSGRATLSHGSNMDRCASLMACWTPTGGRPMDSEVCVDLGREFDGRDIPDRYSVKFEFFYNGAGYSHNILSDRDRYIYNMEDQPILAPRSPFPQPSPSTCSTEDLPDELSIQILCRRIHHHEEDLRKRAVLSLNGVANLTIIHISYRRVSATRISTISRPR
jgi:hypothetical protein